MRTLQKDYLNSYHLKCSCNVHRQQPYPKWGNILIFPSLALLRISNSEKLTRFKVPVAVDTLMAFAGELFNEEIERQSQYNGVQTEVSFLSTRCDSNNNILPRSFLVVCLSTSHDYNTFQVIRIETSLNLFFYFYFKGSDFFLSTSCIPNYSVYNTL